jgi:predicted restriction endonuclease
MSKRFTLELKSKGELFKSRVNWQSARSAIQKGARLKWSRSGNLQACAVCGYALHVEIAHKKAVSDFSDDALIKDINSIENLIPLCPNHHWEFDNKVLRCSDNGSPMGCQLISKGSISLTSLHVLRC